MKSHDERLEAIVKWAKDADGVQALIQTGSLARNDNSADVFSDIDIEIITSSPEILMNDDQWMNEIGELITVLRLDPDIDQEWATRLAIYSDGVKVDFMLAGTERVRNMADKGSLCELYERGYHIVLDKTAITVGLPAPSYDFPGGTLPSQYSFKASVEEFWFEAFHLPKYLARGELWMVKRRDNTMKDLLLCMLEWHPLALSHKPVDIWHNGLRMYEWVDPQTWIELQETFGQFDATDAQRAFEATIQLYGRLGREVAEYTGLYYPQECENHIKTLNRNFLSVLVK